MNRKINPVSRYKLTNSREIRKLGRERESKTSASGKTSINGIFAFSPFRPSLRFKMCKHFENLHSNTEGVIFFFCVPKY